MTAKRRIKKLGEKNDSGDHTFLYLNHISLILWRINFSNWNDPK